jgi:hypothetical protein
VKTQQRKPKVDMRFLRAVAVVDEVYRLYPTERACLKALWQRIRKHKRCHFCNSAKLKLTSTRTGNCGKCGKKFWLTAGTTFDRARSVRPYCVAIKLVERKIPFSARLLSRLCSIAYETALQICKKIRAAVLPAMSKYATLVSSFEFDRVICKRSFETEARQHPVSEQESSRLMSDAASSREVQSISHMTGEQNRACSVEKIAPNQAPAAVSALQSITMWGEPQPQIPVTDIPTAPGALASQFLTSPVNCSTQPFECRNDFVSSAGTYLAHTPSAPALQDAEKQVYDSLSTQPRSMDSVIVATGLSSSVVIAAASMLELANLVEILEGSRLVLSAKTVKKPLQPLFPHVRDRVLRIIKFLKKYFHGVSRRYIQLYLAAYWSFVDRERWSEGAVFDQCCKSAQRLRDFISPVELQVWTA